MKSYTYAHILPETGEILYIGSGQQSRAWCLSKRPEPHALILENLQRMGYSPADYVVVLAQGLSEADARRREFTLIRTVRPPLNRQGISAANAGRGQANHNAVLDPKRVRSIREQHAAGDVSIRALGRIYGIAYSTARKVVTGRAWAHIN